MEERVKKFWQNIRWTDVLTFLFFVLFAAAIWFGHAMHSVRNTRVPVLITYTGKPSAIALADRGLPDTVMIEVSDAGSRLHSYLRNPLHLTIDLHPYIHSDKGTIRVPSDALRRSISDILQGTSRLIETHPEEIVCSYFTEQEKTVVVAFGGQIALANEYQMVGEPVLNRVRTKIYGSDRALSAIDTVYTDSLWLEDVCDTLLLRTALNIPKGVRAENDSVDLTIISERFTEKKFILPVRAIGAPEGYRMRLFPNEVEVSVRVGMSHFAQVHPEDIRVTCNYSREATDKLDVVLDYKNPFITAAWAYPGVVEFILEQ